MDFHGEYVLSDEFEYDVTMAVLNGLKLDEWQDPIWLFDLEHPFLFYAGENDFTIRADDVPSDTYRRHVLQAEFAKNMKHAKTIVVPNSGHNIPGSDTSEGKELDRQIFEFLDSVNKTIS